MEIKVGNRLARASATPVQSCFTVPRHLHLIHAVHAVGKLNVQTVVILITCRLGTCVGELNMSSLCRITTSKQWFLKIMLISSQPFFQLAAGASFLFVKENMQKNGVYIIYYIYKSRKTWKVISKEERKHTCGNTATLVSRVIPPILSQSPTASVPVSIAASSSTTESPALGFCRSQEISTKAMDKRSVDDMIPKTY